MIADRFIHNVIHKRRVTTKGNSGEPIIVEATVTPSLRGNFQAKTGFTAIVGNTALREYQIDAVFYTAANSDIKDRDTIEYLAIPYEVQSVNPVLQASSNDHIKLELSRYAQK